MKRFHPVEDVMVMLTSSGVSRGFR